MEIKESDCYNKIVRRRISNVLDMLIKMKLLIYKKEDI